MPAVANPETEEGLHGEKLKKTTETRQRPTTIPHKEKIKGFTFERQVTALRPR